MIGRLDIGVKPLGHSLELCPLLRLAAGPVAQLGGAVHGSVSGRDDAEEVEPFGGPAPGGTAADHDPPGPPRARTSMGQRTRLLSGMLGVRAAPGAPAILPEGRSCCLLYQHKQMTCAGDLPPDVVEDGLDPARVFGPAASPAVNRS